MQFLWKIGGEAGFGIMTTGMLFAKIAMRSGFYVYDYTEYPSLIRGGHNTTDVMFSDEPVTAVKEMVDLLVCLNKQTYEQHKHRLTNESLVIHDHEEYQLDGPGISIGVPFRKIKRQEQARQIMMNTIAMGTTLALLGADKQRYYEMLREQFGTKGEKIVQSNIHMAEIGAAIVTESYTDHIRPELAKPLNRPHQLLMTGNDAFSLASVMADCRFYAAYPMTPSSTVIASLAAWERKTGMIVRHAEDEIAVILTALGASAMGVRAAVGTSGGGFALMVEAVSFAGIAELPLVIFMSQRPGPATGMPTWTEQADLLFTVNAGHGEFPKIVLTPGDVGEMIELTLEAYRLADLYQTPVIVMSDKLLSESHQSWDQEQLLALNQDRYLDRGKTVDHASQSPYLRYSITEDGISERLIPGEKGSSYQSNSYEHEENSHTSETAEDRIAQVDKRSRKLATYLSTDFQPPQIFGSMDEAKVVFVSWGGTKNPILAAQKLLAAKGITTAFIHFTHIYPMDPEMVKKVMSQEKSYLLVENNATAQFGILLRALTGIDIVSEAYLRYDGRPVNAEKLVDHVTHRFVS